MVVIVFDFLPCFLVHNGKSRDENRETLLAFEDCHQRQSFTIVVLNLLSRYLHEDKACHPECSRIILGAITSFLFTSLFASHFSFNCFFFEKQHFS